MGACSAFLLLASPAAATTYVDAVNGDDDGGANPCTDPMNPCQTIGLGVIFVQNDTDTVFVESGTYNENFSLPRGIHVVASDFNANNADPPPMISGPGGNPTVNVISAPVAEVGEIDGFTINGPFSSMNINDSIVVENNVFDEDTPATSPSFPGSNISITGGTVTIRNNTFDDPLAIDNQIAISLSGGSVTIQDNTFDGFREAIDGLGMSGISITGNTITGLHQASIPQDPDPPVIVEGIGIVLVESSATIERNLIHQPALGGVPVGIYLFDTMGGPATSAVLRRNRIFNLERGVYIIDADGPVSLDGDLIANNTGFGVVSSDGEAPETNLAIANATIYGNGDGDPGEADVELAGTDLTMKSTAIENPIEIQVFPFVDTTCAITDSRGPTTSPPGGCTGFQTNAAPQFVNTSLNDFHLLLSSPLIDLGDPVAPSGASVDIDGDPRALDGNCDGTARRDIGADEVVRDCTPPQTTIDSGPSGTTADTTPTFGFSSSESGSTFQCAVDGAAFGACSGPGATHTTAALAEGAHTFSVRATDAAANTDQTPAERAFTVDVPDPPPPPRDTNPPDTSIKKGPRGRSPDQTPTFRFGSDEAGVTFRCRLDKQAFSRCGRRLTIRVGLGKHVMRVLAVDRAGNRDRTPAKRSFVVIARQRR